MFIRQYNDGPKSGDCKAKIIPVSIIASTYLDKGLLAFHYVIKLTQQFYLIVNLTEVKLIAIKTKNPSLIITTGFYFSLINL